MNIMEAVRALSDAKDTDLAKLVRLPKPSPQKHAAIFLTALRRHQRDRPTSKSPPP